MKFQRFVITIILVLGFVQGAFAETKKKILFYRNPMQPEITSPSPMKDSMGMDYVPVYAEAETSYYCPMHPNVVSDKAGECPICHMRLARREDPVEKETHLNAHLLKTDAKTVCMMHNCPMEKAGQPCPMIVVGEKGETVECPVCKTKMKMQGELSGELLPAGYAEVLISPEKQQLIGIRIARVEKKELKRSLSAPARVAYDPELYDAQINYLREYRTAQGTLRNRELAFKNLVDSRWEAPRLEVAQSKLVLMGMDDESIGELVQNAKADDSLIYLKTGEIWIYADVNESEMAWLRKGDPVHLEVPTVSGKAFESIIQSIGSIVDPDTRRVRVRMRIPNDGYLKPGMLMNVVIRSSTGVGLAVPEEAVFFTGHTSIVFVDKGQGLFDPRQVDVGIKAGDDYEIRKGLAEGERIVVNGNFLLDSESRLKSSIAQAVASHTNGGAEHD